jgi:hypothetical protein
MGRANSTHGSEDEYMQGFGKKNQLKRPLGRPIRRWKKIFKLDLEEIGWRCGLESYNSR